MVFVKREAVARIKNPNGKKRIVMVTDPTNYSEFNAWREAYMQKLDNNPTLTMLAIIEAMKTFDLLAWKQEQEESNFVMGKDLHNVE